MPYPFLLFAGGKRSRIMTSAVDGPVPYELEQRGLSYRVKAGTPSRSDIDFFAYNEVKFHQAGSRYLVDRFTVATDFECKGSPDIRMIFQFDLHRRTMTAILAPPWSTDGRVHKFVHVARLKTADLFRLRDMDFFNIMGTRPLAAVQRLCSA